MTILRFHTCIIYSKFWARFVTVLFLEFEQKTVLLIKIKSILTAFLHFIYVFNHSILELQRNRELDTMKRTWWDDKKVDCPDDNQEGSGITLAKVGGVFISMGGGIVLSLLILLLEICWSKCGRRREASTKVEEMHNGVVVANGYTKQNVHGLNVLTTTEPPRVSTWIYSKIWKSTKT